MNDRLKKKIVIIVVEVTLAFMHVIGIGRNSSEELFMLSASYFSDLALPFGFYFLLSLIEDRKQILKKWWVKAGLIFLLATFAEIGQFFGIYILGRTFDPVDIAVYALGASLAALFDWLFLHIFRFWRIEENPNVL